MELTPDMIYNNPNNAGGVRLSDPDKMRIYYNINRVIKVKRSIIKLGLHPERHKYRCYDPEISVKINNTRVRVRCHKSDLSKIWVYDLQNDEFIICIPLSIDPYGDKASVSKSDIKKRMVHSARIKKFRRWLNEGSIRNDQEVERLQEDSGDFESIQEWGRSKE